MRRALWVLPLLGVIALGSISAQAAEPSKKTEVQKAKILFDRGRELYTLARYEEAIAAFQSAYDARPHPVIFFNLAQCHEKLGNLPAAIANYRRYLEELPNADDRDRVVVVIGNLEARLKQSALQRLTVNSAPAGAEVSLDGVKKGATPLVLEVKSGTYRLELSLPGYANATREVSTSYEQPTQVDVILEAVALRQSALPTGAATPMVTANSGKPKLWTWVALGAGALAAGAGAYFGLAANADAKNLRENLHTQPGEAEQLFQSARRNATTANLLYGAGGALGAAGLTLFFVEGKF